MEEKRKLKNKQVKTSNMENNMQLGPSSMDGTIFQITDVIEGHNVVIDIVYSGGRDENDIEILEFEWAHAESESNPELSEEVLEEINSVLECGLEERYVRALAIYYAGTEVNFDPNEYRDVLGLPEKN